MYTVLAHGDMSVLIQLLHSNQRMHPTLLQSQKYYNTPDATCFGTYRPMIGSTQLYRTFAKHCLHVPELPKAPQYVIHIYIGRRPSCALETVTGAACVLGSAVCNWEKMAAGRSSLFACSFFVHSILQYCLLTRQK